MRLPSRHVLAAALLCLALGACSADPGRPAGDGGSSSSANSAASGSAAADPGAPADAATEDPEALVRAAVDDMGLREEVSQLFLVGVPLDDLAAGEDVVRSGVGGIFLSGRSEAPADDLAATTEQWQSLAPGPALWIAADQEGGSVQTLKGPGFERLPSAVRQGALPPDRLTALAEEIGSALRSAGVNLNLAPVADVVPAGTEADNAPIGSFDRHYGNTAAEVTEAAGAVVDGLADAGVTATLKHFPGLGRVQGNTDDTAAVTDPETTAGDEQVTAFGTLARSAARPFVMASSATYPRIDPRNQAMFSRTVLTALLRERLGFDGVILSDDVGSAEAVQGLPPAERAVRFLAAGGTMVLTVQPADVPAMVEAVTDRARDDEAFAATVDAAVRTALLAKAHAGLLPDG